MVHRLRYLLLQVRNEDDPMAGHEVQCFAHALGCPIEHIAVWDLLRGCPSPRDLAREDIVLLGGSGDYCVSEGGAWMDPAMDAMRELHAMNKPTFASCWGFQAMAAALGGRVVADLRRAEVGTHDVMLTEAGRADPVFGGLTEAGTTFPAQMGHQEVVDRLPDDAILLASTDLANQAFTFPAKNIYCTQFHPELDRDTLLDRLRRYPTYLERITGLPYDEFVRFHTRESVHAGRLLCRFARMVAGE